MGYQTFAIFSQYFIVSRKRCDMGARDNYPQTPFFPKQICLTTVLSLFVINEPQIVTHVVYKTKRFLLAPLAYSSVLPTFSKYCDG